jgi:uncharacterized protein
MGYTSCVPTGETKLRYRVSNVTRGTLLADRAERATSFSQRLVGLLGRERLDFGEGLHLSPCNSVHMFFMRFAIDAVFLSAEGAVVKVYAPLLPWRATSLHRSAASVLELPAGTVHGSGTQVGDEVVFERT